MIATTAAVIVIILVLTAWVTLRVHDRTVKAKWVAPLWGGGACLVIAACAGVYYTTQIRVYDRCVLTAERSQSGRQQTLQLYDTIDAATGTQQYTFQSVIPGKPSLREALDVNLPVLDPAACERP